MRIVHQNSEESKRIEKAKRGNRIAQKELFDSYAPKMLGVCRYYVRTLETAEELLLNGFFKAFSKMDQFKGEGSFEGWLRKIVVNEALSHLKRRRDFLVLDKALEDLPEANKEIIPENDFSKEAIQWHIDRLPLLNRTVFVMFVMEGYSHAEIAKQLNIPVNTSKSQLLRARKTLQEKLKKEQNLGYGI